MSLVVKPPFPRLRRGHSLTDGLLAHWPFYEGSGGNLNDISGRLRTGSINGATWTGSGRGAALDFDGTSDYINVPDTPDLNFGTSQDFSLAAWIRCASAADIQTIIGKGDGGGFGRFLFQVETDGTLRLVIAKSSATVATSSSAVDDNQWHLVVASVKRASVVQLYIDGSPDGSAGSSASHDLTNNVPLNIARAFQSSGRRYFNGETECVSVYGRALSAEEISALYHNPYVVYERPRMSWLGASVDDNSSSSSQSDESSSSSTEASLTSSSSDSSLSSSSSSSSTEQSFSSSSSSSSSTEASETSSSSSSSQSDLSSSSSTEQSFTSSSSSSSLSSVSDLSSSSSSSTEALETSSSSSSSSSSQSAVPSSSSSTEQELTSSSSSSTVASETSSSSSASETISDLGAPLFRWDIDWSDPINAEFLFDMRQLTIGFGQELFDVKQDHVIQGFEFECDFRDEEIEAIDSFMDGLKGRAYPFWLPGPQLQFKIADGLGSNTFKITEQGAENSWQLYPGAYVCFKKSGEQKQFAKITSVVDNGDGTETVTFTEARVTALESDSSSSENSSSSGHSSSSSSSSSSLALTTSSSSSGHSSSSSSENSSSSSSSEGVTSSSSFGGVSSSSSSSAFITIDETWDCFPLFLVRLAEDSERVQILAERWQRRSFKVVEIPHEYSVLNTTGALTDPEEPVFLYKFWVDLPDGTWTWRYTSHATNITTQNADFQSSSSSGLATTSSSSSGEDSSSSSSSSTEALDTSSSNSSSSESSTSTVETSSSSYSSSSTDASESSSSTSLSSSSSSSSSLSSSSSSSSQSSSSSELGTTSSSSSSSEESNKVAWSAVPITHSGLTRSAKRGGTVNVEGDYDQVEPLKLLMPLRLTAPLRLQILKTSTDLNETEVLFEGECRKPSHQGRKVRIESVEWSDSMQQRVPDFFIQTQCNYRLFEGSTCKVLQSDHEVSVTVLSETGVELLVESASLSGKAANHYAQGWIDIGTGVSGRNVRFIVSSNAAVGNRILLRLNKELNGVSVPIAGTLLPGCDGLRSTCINKFDNLVNFGGHETPQENLAVVAIRTDPTTGGKK